MSELQIPREAQRAYDQATIELMLTAKTGQLGSRSAPENVRAIGTPFVVVELRRVRDYVRDNPGASAQDVAVFALQRANELEG